MKAVRPHTIKGIILCYIIQLLCLPFYLIKGKKWLRARVFEENPRTMGFKDIVYFAYKYYFKSPLLADSIEVEKHFKEKPVIENQIVEPLVTVSIGGDLMPYEMIHEEFTQNLWDEVGPEFFGSDVVFANLETPLHEGLKNNFVPEVMLYDMHFNTDEKTFDVFNGQGKYRGFDVLSVANNHTLDQGSEGIDKTIEFLNKKYIKSVGAKSQKEDKDFEILEVNGIKIGFVAFTYSLNQFLPKKGEEWRVNYLPLNTKDCSIDMIERQVKDCRNAGAEFIICSIHAGNAYQVYPSEVTVNLFQKIFETCGVDVIAGGHPHNMQPWRSYTFKDPNTGREKQGFAIYSLGDFIAYDIYTWCHVTAFLKLEIGKNLSGDLVFNPTVKPLLMLRENKHLRLVYAKEYFAKVKMTSELKDMKVLYDICVS